MKVYEIFISFNLKYFYLINYEWNESMVKPKNTTSSSNVADNNNQCLIKPKLQNKTLIDLEDKVIF